MHAHVCVEQTNALQSFLSSFLHQLKIKHVHTFMHTYTHWSAGTVLLEEWK